MAGKKLILVLVRIGKRKSALINKTEGIVN